MQVSTWRSKNLKVFLGHQLLHIGTDLWSSSEELLPMTFDILEYSN